MITVNHPVIEKDNQTTNVKVKLEFDKNPFHVPDTLWFSFPKKFKSFLTNTMDPYLTSIVFVGMATKQDIYVKGKLSKKLKYNIQAFQEFYSFWYPKRLNKIKVFCDEEVSEYSKRPNHLISCFTGGVDSFYSLMNHLPGTTQNSSYELKYCLYVNGYDISLNDQYTYRDTSGAYSKMLKERFNIELITVATNLRHIIDPYMNWEQTHGSSLISAGLLFSKGYGKMIVPSSDGYDTLIDGHGSHPITDPLLGTEGLEVIHHALAVSRYDKVKAISSFEPAYDTLRVCWVKPDGIYNCCECAKCVQSMLFLKEMDALYKFTTFPKKLELLKIKNYKIHHRDTFFFKFAEEYVRILQTKGKEDLSNALKEALKKSQSLDLFKSK